MAIPKSFIDDLRARASLARYAQRHLTWDRKKTRPDKGEYWACCPFHQENTASFKINDAQGLFYCFGCKEKGTLFDFVERMEQVGFQDAVRALAAIEGMTVPVMDERERQREELGTRLAEACSAAAAYYREMLESADGKTALAYLREERGLSATIIEQFGLGFAPARSGGLIRRLKVQGVEDDDAMAAGLLRRSENGDLYEFFRNRVMFPVEAPGRGVVAFGGRAMDDGPKYINSPESPIFHKSRVLYHMGPAREAARKERQLVVAEGYMDVIALAAAGFGNVVAPMGTALTVDQLDAMWGAADEMVIALDGDEAGRRAADRTLDLVLPLLRAGRSIGFALLPDGMDPDDLLRARGPGGMRAVLEDSIPTFDMVWRRLLLPGMPDTPERAAALDRGIDEIVGMLTDDSLRRHYRQKLRKRLWETGYRQRPRSRGRPSVTLEARSSPIKGDIAPEGPARRSQEFAILQGLYRHPNLVPEFVEDIGDLEFSAEDLDSLRGDIISAVASGEVGNDHWQKIGKRLGGIGRGLPHVDGIVPFLQTGSNSEQARSGLGTILVEYRADHIRRREMQYVCIQVREGRPGGALEESLREATGALHNLLAEPNLDGLDEQEANAAAELREYAKSRPSN